MNVANDFIGKYVIIRSYASGVHFGVLEAFDEYKNVLLKDTRRIWSWKNVFTLSEVSVSGIEEGKMSVLIPRMLVCEICEIIPCSAEAIEKLRGMKVYEPE